MLPTTAAAAVALAALGCVQLHERGFLWRLSAKPKATNSLGRGFVEPLLAKKARSTELNISTAVQQYSLTPTASRKSTKTMKSTRLTIRTRTRRIQSKTSPVEEGRFRLAESDCKRNGLSSSYQLSTYRYVSYDFYGGTAVREYRMILHVRKSKYSKARSTAQHRTARQGRAPHGTARPCGSELALRFWPSAVVRC